MWERGGEGERLTVRLELIARSTLAVVRVRRSHSRRRKLLSLSHRRRRGLTLNLSDLLREGERDVVDEGSVAGDHHSLEKDGAEDEHDHQDSCAQRKE